VNTVDRGSIWVRDSSGKESPAGSGLVQKNFPRLSPSGRLLAYSTVEDEKSSLGITAVGGGFTRTLCDNCGFPEDWTSDEKKLLIRSRTARSFALLDVDSAALAEVLRSPDWSVFGASLSPDDRWIAFHTRRSGERRRVFLSPLAAGRAAEPGQWLPVTDGSANDMMPRWSHDGSLLYFASERDGFRCNWAQRVDPRGKSNSGQPFPVYHSHARQRSLINLSVGEFGFDVSARKLVFSVGETTGAIWMTQISL
jgi:Tol biopolymer transport system component